MNGREWTLEKMVKVAKKFKSKKKFFLADYGAYRTAKRKGWFEQVTAHMIRPKFVRVTDKEIRIRLKEYKDLHDLITRNQHLYRLARRRLGKQITDKMRRKK